MNYETLKKQTNTGWNTWNTSNVLSYVHLPEGFCINLCIKDYCEPKMLRESLIGRQGGGDEKIFPGARSYDGLYTQLNLKYYDLELDVQTTVINDEQIVLLTPIKTGLKTPTLVIEGCLLWGKDGTVSKKDGIVSGEFSSRSFKIYTTGHTVNAQHTYSLSPYIAVELDKPIVVSTMPCTVEEAKAHIDAARKQLDDYNNSFGKHSEAYTAMKTCLAWDTIYEAEHDRVCSPVSRIWNIGWGGYVLFDWDTYFASLMASYDNKDLGMLNAIAITDEVTESGFIPNFGAAHDYKSRDRSQPPVGSYVCLEIYKRWQEKWFLEKVFDALMTWNTWFIEHRSTDEGYLCWGSDPFTPVSDKFWEKNGTNCRYGAALESGLDNSPMYDDMPFDEERHILLLADVGLMGLFIMDCRSLCEIAEILGKTEYIPTLKARKEKVEAAMQTLWSEDEGIFLNKRLDNGELSRRISPTNFYALQADNITEAQKTRIMKEHFYNPDKFWGEYILPMISRDDPAYNDQDYWRGRIWAPTNFLAYIAMKHQKLDKECADLAERSEKLILKEWREHGHVHENYNGTTGEGCDVGNSDRFYHWGGLLAYIALIDDEKK